MPNADPPTCTTVRPCTAIATHEITGSAKIRGVPTSASASHVHLLACEQHLKLAADRVRSRETRSVNRLPDPQPTLFDNL
jgi:hypothetical protein